MAVVGGSNPGSCILWHLESLLFDMSFKYNSAWNKDPTGLNMFLLWSLNLPLITNLAIFGRIPQCSNTHKSRLQYPIVMEFDTNMLDFLLHIYAEFQAYMSILGKPVILSLEEIHGGVRWPKKRSEFLTCEEDIVDAESHPIWKYWMDRDEIWHNTWTCHAVAFFKISRLCIYWEFCYSLFMQW